jgi:CHASE3 domain sensor protein
MKVPLEKKIDWGFALGFLILVVVSVVSYRTVAHLIETSRWVAQAREQLLALEEFGSALKDAQRGERGYIITGDRTFLDPYQRALPELERLRGRLRELTAQDPEMQQQLEQLERLSTSKLTELADAISLRDSAGFIPAVELVKTGEGKRLMEQISRHLDGMKTTTKRNLVARLEANEAQARVARFVVISGMFFALALVAAANLLIRPGLPGGVRHRIQRGSRSPEYPGRGAPSPAAEALQSQGPRSKSPPPPGPTSLSSFAVGSW